PVWRKVREGFTKKVEEEPVVLSNGQNVTLVNVPSLFEPSEKATADNALELTSALPLDY
ncbi:hypothetical protein BGZ92_006686, partial [Podila epicladia]